MTMYVGLFPVFHRKGVHIMGKKQKAKPVEKAFCFVNYRIGEPARLSSYDTHLYKLCFKAQLNPQVSKRQWIHMSMPPIFRCVMQPASLNPPAPSLWIGAVKKNGAKLVRRAIPRSKNRCK